MKAFYVNEEDAAILKEVVQDYRRRHPFPARASLTPFIGEMPGDYGDDIFTPEVYVALIPEDGIPALIKDGDNYIPGYADCTIYKMWPVEASTGTGTETGLIATYFDHRVNNLSTLVITRSGDQIFCLVHRDKYGDWFVMPSGSGSKLVELCSLEDAERNVPYTALLGTWDPSQQIYCYDNAETVYAIDHRIGPPTAEIGWKGQYQEEISTNPEHNGKIYVLISLDCELPPEGCNECLGTGSGA